MGIITIYTLKKVKFASWYCYQGVQGVFSFFWDLKVNLLLQL